jgi:hypothetical protein
VFDRDSTLLRRPDDSMSKTRVNALVAYDGAMKILRR